MCHQTKILETLGVFTEVELRHSASAIGPARICLDFAAFHIDILLGFARLVSMVMICVMI